VDYTQKNRERGFIFDLLLGIFSSARFWEDFSRETLNLLPLNISTSLMPAQNRNKGASLPGNRVARCRRHRPTFPDLRLGRAIAYVYIRR